jgi:hypothetical protein
MMMYKYAKTKINLKRSLKLVLRTMFFRWIWRTRAQVAQKTWVTAKPRNWPSRSLNFYFFVHINHIVNNKHVWIRNDNK